MPAIPPKPLKIIEEKENISLPHSIGINPPTVEPIPAPSQIKDFDPML
jgi:hypothetical protein